jgi:hypothetical protein
MGQATDTEIVSLRKLVPGVQIYVSGSGAPEWCDLYP